MVKMRAVGVKNKYGGGSHSHTDMQLIPPEKIHSSRDSNLIDKATTLEPHGLNRRDELL